MRRIFGIVAVLLLLAAVALAFLPLSVVTQRYLPGLEAESVSGTIWNGRIRGARYQGLGVGDVDAGLALRPLLSGEAEIGFARLGEPLSGRATLARDRRQLQDVSGRIRLPAMGGIELVLALEDLGLETDAAGRCRAVSGTVSATLANIPVVGSIPPLEGAPRCENGAFRAPLALSDRSVGLDLLLAPTGEWQADLVIRNQGELVSRMMELAGFQRTAEGLSMRFEGRAG